MSRGCVGPRRDPTANIGVARVYRQQSPLSGVRAAREHVARQDVQLRVQATQLVVHLASIPNYQQ